MKVIFIRQRCCTGLTRLNEFRQYLSDQTNHFCIKHRRTGFGYVADMAIFVFTCIFRQILFMDVRKIERRNQYCCRGVAHKNYSMLLWRMLSRRVVLNYESNRLNSILRVI